MPYSYLSKDRNSEIEMWLLILFIVPFDKSTFFLANIFLMPLPLTLSMLKMALVRLLHLDQLEEMVRIG